MLIENECAESCSGLIDIFGRGFNEQWQGMTSQAKCGTRGKNQLQELSLVEPRCVFVLPTWQAGAHQLHVLL